MHSPESTTVTDFPSLLQRFFTERLVQLRRASPNTIASYRDTFRLLLRFAVEQVGKQPSALAIDDLDAPFVASFLAHLESDRGNSVRSRNVRLAAIRSFFRYVALNEPCHAAVAQRVLAIPNKRFERRLIEFLTRDEAAALLAAPDRATWIGRRDHALLLLAIQTGLRVSELIGLRRRDVSLDTGPHVRCRGKGRKERVTPLRKDVVRVLNRWFAEQEQDPAAPLFPSVRGGHLSRDAVERLVRKHSAAAASSCPSLATKRITAHVLRHTTAMDLLQHGVDRAVIALWLGHESVETTQMYLHADLSMKERALAKTTADVARVGRYRPDDSLLAFLNSL